MARQRLDLTGQSFGNLEVIGPSGTNEKGATLWECHCNRCGNNTVLIGHRLTEKHSPITDCGCKKRQKGADLSGQVFGPIAVIKRVGSTKHGDKLYLCNCSVCGNTREMGASQIKMHLKSCGCQHYTSERMATISAKGVEANIVAGTNLSSTFRREANANSKTGVRGVFPERKRPGQYRAAVQVCGERAIKCGFASIDSAKKWRDKARAELLEKHNLIGV